MIILGIETSCDETALALIETRGSGENFELRVIESLVHSQAELHSAYGGVYPNLAKREHSKNLIPLLHELFKKSGTETRQKISSQELETSLKSISADAQNQNSELLQSFGGASFLENIPKIDAIAVTEGPGLEPTLWVGITFARILASLWGLPIIPVNHMEGHVVGSLLVSDQSQGEWQKLKDLKTPAIALLISGGHTELVKVDKRNSAFTYTILGQTLDDAVGEAFDKVARILELPYPGGPHISKLSQQAVEEGIASPVKLPRPMLRSGDLNFSFSGLKTAVLYAVRDAGKLTDEFRKGLAYEFEQAVAETLVSKLRGAIIETGAQAIIVGGGVSANSMLRDRFTKLAAEYGLDLFLPSTHISGDNALMIALAGALHSGQKSRQLVASGTKRLGQE